MKIGIDIGGTKTRIALINSEYKIIDIKIIDTNKQDFLETYELIKKYLSKQNDIELISFCCPGPLDIENGIILDPPNLPGWHNLKILEIFKQDFTSCKVKMMNDANAAALGQYNNFKKLECSRILLFFTISTGIGGGLVIDGKIYEGYSKIALEPANTMIYHDEVDTKPLHGIEYYTSGTGIKNNYDKNCDIADLFKSNTKQDIEYLEIIKKRLASFFATSIGFLNPGIIVVGGSVAEFNKEFFNKVFVLTNNLLFDSAKNSTKFEFAFDMLNSTLIGLVQ